MLDKRVCLTFAIAAAVAFGGCTTRPTTAHDEALAHRVQGLVDRFFNTENDADDEPVRTEARALFAERGIPTVAQVGDEAAYAYVLLNAMGQPAEFRRQFLDAVVDPTHRGDLPADAVIFAAALVRQLAIEERYRTLQPTHPALRDEISSLVAADQAVRQKEGFDLKMQEAQDARTAAPLRAIFDRYGVPTFDMVGAEAAKDFAVMVQHQSPAFRAVVLPKLKANVDVGQADPGVYAMVYDRTRRDQGRKQLYGEQLECRGKTLELAPIDDEAQVDRRRAELGLMRLTWNARMVRAVNPPMCEAIAASQR